LALEENREVPDKLIVPGKQREHGHDSFARETWKKSIQLLVGLWRQQFEEGRNSERPHGVKLESEWAIVEGVSGL
jgi:hypothetical protein